MNRSEIHETMKCPRCERNAQMSDNDAENMMEASDDQDPTARSSPCAEKADDIGGFAEFAGCLHRLKSSEKQVSLIAL